MKPKPTPIPASELPPAIAQSVNATTYYTRPEPIPLSKPGAAGVLVIIALACFIAARAMMKTADDARRKVALRGELLRHTKEN